MNQYRMRFLLPVIIIAVLTASSICEGSIHGHKTLKIDFSNKKEAREKASWSPSDKLTITKQGLGWDGNGAASYDGWIQTKPMALGYSWRVPYGITVRVTIQPPPTEIVLNSGQKMTPYSGDVYVRYSPDLEHWSSWIVLQHSLPQSTEEKKNLGRHYKSRVSVSRRERSKYSELLSAYSKLDVPWKSDEESAVRWILSRQPKFFSKNLPFIGYVEFLFEGSIRGGQRIKSLKVDVSYGMSGLHYPAKDKDAYKVRDSIPWGFKTEEKSKTEQKDSLDKK